MLGMQSRPGGNAAIGFGVVATESVAPQTRAGIRPAGWAAAVCTIGPTDDSPEVPRITPLGRVNKLYADMMKSAVSRPLFDVEAET
ncbi:hypothetical protein CDL15_Pgr012691 [Punica granatum]|uniref:Uncharacterized protein n=1 Tax=Punica granatum TaxID=22663 RepID=A0A218XEQ0_PUNGR|nr:hypothetical protein CDL15_Pgr012691 [Punica granatum]